MLKHALNYWSIKNTDDLDPMVKLIMEALSSELYNLGNEIKDGQVRILEKIAGLLTPDFLTSPKPAHGILYAAPVEPTELLTVTTGFIAQHKLSSRQNEVLDTDLEVAFAPIEAVQLFDVQISYIATGGNLFSYDALFNKELLAQVSAMKPVENNTLWLGLRVNPQIEDIQQLYFYFDWKNLEVKAASRLHELLPLTGWYLDDQELQAMPGLPYPGRPRSADAYQSIFTDYDLLSLIEKDIKQYYDPMFVTVSDKHLNKISGFKRPFPLSFITVFADHDLQNLKEPLLWLKIVFPASMQQDFLNQVYVYPNAFPVMNRKLNDLKYRLKGGSNIIPLKTGAMDQFLSVKSLTDEIHEYHPVPYRNTEEEASGTYSLRYGGVERFDSRNARELISYLMELLRSESAAFAAYGYDFIATTLKEMNQKISLMEQKTKGYINNAVEVPSYIIVKPFEGQDMMFAEYWTTLADAANNLRSGTKLQLVKSGKVKQDAISLLTTTTGGKNRLRPEDRLNAFRYGIMTRNRIITKEDIRNFCFYEMGNRIQKVNIEKGFEVSNHSKEAFRRTIDITLTPGATDVLNNKDWQLLCEQLKSKLQTRSGMSNYYRVMVQKAGEAG